jgi:putative DNA primase/helicase
MRGWLRRYPEIGVIAAGDNDHTKARELKADGTPKPNVGKVAAEAAAEAVGGIVVMPEFAPEESSLSDWNDFTQKHGLEHARAAFRRALQLAERENSVQQR